MLTEQDGKGPFDADPADSDRPAYDDSGRCPFAPLHKFVGILDEQGKAGILCIRCDYVLYEHVSNTWVADDGRIVEPSASQDRAQDSSGIVETGAHSSRTETLPAIISAVNLLLRVLRGAFPL